jgi:shikimate kinase
MGAGKTTLGRLIARDLGYEFYDSDKVIEERTGVTIATIFDIEGEAGFREREKKIIAELAELNNIVMATGGGAILLEENRNVLKSRGFVVYLKVSVRQQLMRTSRDHSRPLLQTSNPKQRLETLARERNHLYEEIADLSIDTDRYHASTLKSRIIKAFKNNLS